VPLEKFWVVVGLLFLVGGVWESVDIEVSLAPIIMIAAGAALLLSIVRGKKT